MTQQPPVAGVPVCYRHPGRESHIRCQRCGRPICPDCMRDAPVGFQCPSCVAEGAKSTRSGLNPYGGRRSANPAATSIGLIGINVFVWVLVLATGWRDSSLVARLGLSPRGVCESIGSSGAVYTQAGTRSACVNPANTGGDGRWVAGVADGSYWQLVTSMFLHVEIWHIAANMLSLYVLGPQIERVLGRTRFLALYFLSGLTGSAVIYWLSATDSVSLGASGAIFGLFGALAVIVHKVGGDLRSIAGLLAVNIFITFVIPNVSWQAHLGGLVGGAVVTGILVYAPRGNRTRVQALGLGGIGALVVLAVILRSAVLA